jgi:hypothetical protein
MMRLVRRTGNLWGEDMCSHGTPPADSLDLLGQSCKRPVHHADSVDLQPMALAVVL